MDTLALAVALFLVEQGVSRLDLEIESWLERKLSEYSID